jgi:hypothetical protein
MLAQMAAGLESGELDPEAFQQLLAQMGLTFDPGAAPEGFEGDGEYEEDEDGGGVRVARPVQVRPVPMQAPPEVQELLSAAASAAQEKAGKPDFSNVGPDDPCPCGSGKKFKQCHRNRV